MEIRSIIGNGNYGVSSINGSISFGVETKEGLKAQLHVPGHLAEEAYALVREGMVVALTDLFYRSSASYVVCEAPTEGTGNPVWGSFVSDKAMTWAKYQTWPEYRIEGNDLVSVFTACGDFDPAPYIEDGVELLPLFRETGTRYLVVRGKVRGINC